MAAGVVTPKNMRLAYEFLREVLFSEINIPLSSKITFKAKRLKNYHGLYEYPENIVSINTATGSMTQLMQIMAHEMIHVALEQNADTDHDKHDQNFEALARIIEHEMGWPKGSV